MPIDRFRSDPRCRVLVLTSPKAGSGAGRQQIPRLVTLLEQAGVQVEVVHSADRLRRKLIARDSDQTIVVVAAGGDGTVSLAASAMQCVTEADACSETVARAAIVPMPLGTENLLARHFGHVASAESVLKTIRRGQPYRMDLGIANDRPFLIMATCGFDAEVVRGMHLTRRGHIRRFSYARPIIRALWKYRFPTLGVLVDGDERIECRWAMVFNLPRYGGALRIEPDAVGDDGLLDFIGFPDGSIASGLKYVAAIWTGRHQKLRNVVRRRCRMIEIASDQRVPFQLDGDYAGRLPLKMEIQPGRVVLLLPPRE